jgi:Ca2+:H+ antiporter
VLLGTTSSTNTRGASTLVKRLYWLLPSVPAAVLARILGANSTLVFFLSALAIVPLAASLSESTEQLSEHTGPAIGGVLGATLGNFAELIISAYALRAGYVDLVKASLTGTILGNLLLVLGASLLAGGVRRRSQKFNPHLAGMSVSLLIIAVVGLVVPALFHALHPDPTQSSTLHVSVVVAVLLIAGYLLSLLYSLGTHRAIFAAPERDDDAHPRWSLRRTLLLLGASAVTIAVMSELLVGSVESAATAMGLSHSFVGLIVLPIIGNAAENSSAIVMAIRNRMDLAVMIAAGSSVQVALLVAPILVLLGLVLHQPMDLAFSTFEVVAVALAVWIVSSIVRDAESNWLEGALLILVYGVLAVAFFFI